MVLGNGVKRAFGAHAWKVACCTSALNARMISQVAFRSRGSFGATAALPRSTRQWTFQPDARVGSRYFATVPIAAKAEEEEDAPAVKMTYAEQEAEIAALRKEIAELKKAGEQPEAGKFMGMIKQYGPALLIWWEVLYVGGGVCIYTGLETGWFGGADALQLIKSLGLDHFFDLDDFDPKNGNVALAFLLNELMEPVRAPIAFGTVAIVKRVFTRATTKSVRASS
ncbi:TPA: hypothetical protein N0F65_003097 [Lagenidium giganteum]|uniref:DUF1279 domain-containing protein n=1 Tax=Lagenidium giganteum TaxID=4803 RepID=A0AAV2YWS0_9STRA|nr:TPA: hypothetical protein N0F65_003097 [Lagenidium giganteum]